MTLLVLGACSSSSGSSDGSAKATTTTAGASTTSTAGSGTTVELDPSTGKVVGKALARYASYRSKQYDTPSHWVCRPDTPHDICHHDLDSTTITAAGKLTVHPFVAAKDPKIDCFYVYPTISQDKTRYSDWNASPAQEGYVTLNQAARLRADCRVFAPVYRQQTLTGLTSLISGGHASTQKGDPFADVLDAFRTYMAEDNHGRGFVLIGHSQGASMLNQLIRTEIDPHPDVRAKLVSAYLAGGAVEVPPGKTVGGDFAHVPLCTSAAEAGCVVTWDTFRSTATPPANSYFGRGATAKDGTKLVAGCVSPAAPGGGVGQADAEFPADRTANILSGGTPSAAGTSPWLAASAGTITTPYVSLPGLVTVRCTSKDGFAFEEATLHPTPGGPRANDIPGDLTPEWGLHLVDVNLVMGNIVSLVAQQAKAYAG